MSTKERKPLPHEHKEIAAGSGPAAILLFLHIAVIGYLGYLVFFLATGNREVFWNLVPLRAGMIYYFPAAFATATYLPTDPLTRIVGLITRLAGTFAWVVFGVGLAVQAAGNDTYGPKPGLETVGAVVAGVVSGVLLRLIFVALIGKTRVFWEKNAGGKGVPE